MMIAAAKTAYTTSDVPVHEIMMTRDMARITDAYNAICGIFAEMDNIRKLWNQYKNKREETSSLQSTSLKKIAR